MTEGRTNHLLVIGLLIGLAAVLVIVAGGLAVSQWYSTNLPEGGPSAGMPVANPAVASAQGKAVADFLSAWVADDRATMASQVTTPNLPWKGTPPPVPAGVPRSLVASVAKPHMEGGNWVLGDHSSVFVTLTADGAAPIGTVTAQVEFSQGMSRTVVVSVVKVGDRWKLETVNGQPVATGLDSLLR